MRMSVTSLCDRSSLLFFKRSALSLRQNVRKLLKQEKSESCQHFSIFIAVLVLVNQVAIVGMLASFKIFDLLVLTYGSHHGLEDLRIVSPKSHGTFWHLSSGIILCRTARCEHAQPF